MAEIHDQLQAEGLTKEAFATMLRGRRGLMGRLYLTNQRLVFLQSNQFLMAFGAIGGLLMGVVKPKKLALEIPLASITGIERGKFGINKNVLEISYGADEPARFAVKYDEWEAAINGARPQPAAA